MYNNIAYSDSNPFQGQLFNEPNGIDVYNGIHINYQNNDVTRNNFLSVFKDIPIKDTDDLPVLNNILPEDNIFIYYSYHSGNGVVLIGFIVIILLKSEYI